jgi:alkaline phosphatase D
MFLGAAAAGVVLAACGGDDDAPGPDDGTARTTVADTATDTVADTATTPTVTTTTAAPTTTSIAVDAAPTPAADLAGDPFTLGVASGDPLPDAVVLWTRLAPAEGPPAGDLSVAWDVARDDAFVALVASGTAPAPADHAHAVHVDVTGLPAATTLWFRFRVGAATSPVGRTRTAPVPGTADGEVRLAVTSCQHYPSGTYASHRHLAADDVDAVVWLGDYIYEDDGTGLAGRDHTGGRADTLDRYRARYAQYRSDPDLRAAHAAHPWIVTWDDHEVANGYAGLAPGPDGGDPAAFPDRRAAAYRAWWEHMPVRIDPPTGPDLRIHRQVAFGDLVDVFALDGRQYRTDQPCGADDAAVSQPCGDDDAAEGTMLGLDQEAWLADGMASSTARWTILANQTVMTPLPLLGYANMDQWDGYRAARRRLLGSIPAGADVVVVTGDIHASAVADVRPDDGFPVRATELVAPPTSSHFPESVRSLVEAAVGLVPDVRWFDTVGHGYLRLTASPTQCLAEFLHVTEVVDPVSDIGVVATFRIDAGTPGAVET